MRQPNDRVAGHRGPHRSPSRRRSFGATAVKVTAAILVIYFLSGCHSLPPYAYSGAESGHFAAPAGNTCNKPTVIPMDPKNAQSGITKGNYYITNDTWNADRYNGLSQALYVCNYNNWYTVATISPFDGAVKTSPNVQETWSPTPSKLSDWKSISSHYSDVPPGTGPGFGAWEFEYDIWLNGLADSRSTEVMVWTYDNGQAPNGSLSGSFTDAGHTYDVFRSPPPYQYIAFVDRSGDLSGNVNLLDFFRYVISRGWMPSSSTLYQICNGVELASTNSRSEKFEINNFSISMQPYP
jgi:hypothetical protein